MFKKSIITIFIITLLSLFCINISYAEDNSMMQNLGNTISNSINKTESSLHEGKNKIENTWNTMTNTMENTITRNTDYSAYRTSADETAPGNMTSTAWTWVIISMVAVIIIAAIWFYAVQSTDRR